MTVKAPPKEHYPSIQAMVSSAINSYWQQTGSFNEESIFMAIKAYFEREEEYWIARVHELEQGKLPLITIEGLEEARLKVRKIKWILLKGEPFMRSKIQQYLLNRAKAKREINH